MYGYIIKSETNNAAVFFPATGWRAYNNIYEFESTGCYWSRYNVYINRPNRAYIICFRYGEMGKLYLEPLLLARHGGCTIRPVYVGQE